VCKIKNVYLRTEFRSIAIRTRSIRKGSLHDLNLVKIIAACFVGTGDFLIRYSNGHTK
jgi:hypothetical protein